jgi:glycosyltransferase involved in cell wall biosynthesis
MKVLVVHNYYQQRGGEDVVSEAEVALLRDAGHEVEFFTVHNKDITRWWQKAATAVLTIYNPWARAKLAAKLKTFRPDVVHVHNFFPQFTPSIFDACRAAGVPSVMTLHNFRILCPTAFLFHDEALREQSLRRSAFWTVRHGTYHGSLAGTFFVACMVDFHKWAGTWRRKVDRLIALTDFAKAKFVEGGLEPAQIVVKGNAVPDPLKGRDALPSARRGALYVGRLSQEKGISTLLSAWAEIEYPLTIVGDGPLRTLCEGAQSPHISYVGPLDRDAVYAEMRKAAFLVLPSVWYEMFPMTLVEAFANNLPVIASRLGGLASLLDEGVTGLAFTPGCPEDVRAKVRWAIENPGAMADMGARGRAVYENLYSTEENYKNLMQIYAGVMAAKGELPVRG